ncbi:MAG TPA: aldo/keto reductase [Armatimonadota bacterium]|jgi:aryl-alcohol dehydrogenase-like predicted oxidoreductase
MRYRPLGNSGIHASVVAFGAWAIGGWTWGGSDDQQAIAAVQAGLDAGINFLDTAPAYGLGRSEEVVGRALVGRRDQAILATKCGLVWHTDRGNFFFNEDGQPVHRYLGAESLRYEVEQSLRRLQTDYIDLLQTHWQDPTTPIEETMTTLEALRREGKIRALGVSNVTREQLEEYGRYGTVDVIQEHYSMMHRDIETTLLPYCREHGVAALAYSPLAQGLLTGKVGPEREFPAGDMRAGNPQFSRENRARVAAFLAQIQPLADARGLTLAQLTIAWTVAQPGLTHALVGARNPEQARENAGAGEVELTAAEVAQITAALESSF